MIEYLVTQNLPFGGIIIFYMFYFLALVAFTGHIYFSVESILTSTKYENKQKERLESNRLEIKYIDFIYGVKEINAYYRYWRVV